MTGTLTREKIDEIFAKLHQTAEGRRKLAASAQQPMESRCWYKSVAAKLWDTTEHSCAYVVSEGDLTTVDLAAYSGEVIEGEVLLKKWPRDFKTAYEFAMDSVVKEVAWEENERFHKLISGVPGVQVVEAPSRTAALDQILETQSLQAILMGHDQYAKMTKARELEPSGTPPLSFCGNLRVYGDGRTPILVSRMVAEEIWAFAPWSSGGGLYNLKLDFEMPGDRIKWRANLKMGLADPSKVFQIKVTP